MSVDLQQVAALITEIEKLSPTLRLQLVQRVLQSLPPPSREPSSILRFGEFSGDETQMSTEEDFALIDRLDEAATLSAATTNRGRLHNDMLATTGLGCLIDRRSFHKWEKYSGAPAWAPL